MLPKANINAYFCEYKSKIFYEEEITRFDYILNEDMKVAMICDQK